jgi:hypothetical protein
MKRLRRQLRLASIGKQFKRCEQDFSRQRVLEFGCVAVLILRGHKLSLQNSLNKFFSRIGNLFTVPSASALCQARQKLRPELFAHLTEFVCRDFYRLYEPEGLVERWRGHRLLACDGTYLNLPDNEQTRAEFFVQTNQFESGAAVQALSCVLYDVLNGLVLGATLGTRTGEKEPLLGQLWEQTEAGDILVLDRHYADYRVLAMGVKTERGVVIRLPENSFKESQALFRKGKRGETEPSEKVVELQCPASARKYIRAYGLPEKLRVRFVRVELANEEVEVLVTTLIDGAQYRTADFKALYGLRWREETFFGRLKNIFEAERFSGKSPLAIKQDYYGVLFLATLENVFAASDQRGLNEQWSAHQSQEAITATETPPGVADSSGVRQPQINHAISYLAMMDRVVELLLGRRSTKRVLEEMHHLFRTSPTRVRPGRHFPRESEKTHLRKKLRWHKYGKTIVA